MNPDGISTKDGEPIVASSPPATSLPDDFARRVIVAARAERRRRARRRLAGALCIMLLAAAVPLANSMRTRNQWDESTARARRGWPQESRDAAIAYRLARQNYPHAVGDYLLPGSGTLTEFASTYSDASWQYDPYWIYYR
jgi:hypothetical protein